MADLLSKLGDIYSPAVAESAKGILDAIENGELTLAKESIEVLGGSQEEELARHHLSSTYYLSEGMFNDAVSSLRSCVAMRPDVFLTDYCELLLEGNQQEAAFAQLTEQAQRGAQSAVLVSLGELLESYPEQTMLLKMKVDLCLRAGDEAGALQTCLKLPDSRLQMIYDLFTQIQVAPVSERFETEFKRILEDHSYPRPRIQAISHLTLSEKLGGWIEDETPPEVISRDRLIHPILRYQTLSRADIELFLTALRKKLLEEAARQPERALLCIELLFSIALQCDKNEYAYYCGIAENAFVDRAQKEILCQLSYAQPDPLQILGPLMLILMYRSPLEVDGVDRLLDVGLGKVYAPVADFIRTSYDNHVRETDLAVKFANERNIEDSTSVRVALMYEDNPYPRWTARLRTNNPNGLSLPEVEIFSESPAWDSERPEAIKSVLIAGCGTGQHPIQFALNYPETTVTAIDISCRSLAYARMKAEEHGVRNIAFRRCDILDLPDWDEQFDMVDSIGVIHHMSDPETGLQALLTRLRPSGVLRLGLYSKAARQDVRAFRARNPIGEEGVTVGEIRAIRHSILNSDIDDAYQGLLRSPDFYSLSGCRDLLLHTQETQFTIPEIAMMLERNGLEFIRFRRVGNVHKLMRRAMGPNADIFDLKAWERAETAVPRMFVGMYEFFCRRK